MKEVKTGKKRLKWILGAVAAVLVAAVGIALFFLLGAPKQEAKPTAASKLYWNVDGKNHREGKEIRFASSDGYVYMNFAVDGSQERIAVADITLAAAIDMQEVVGLVLDENGVAVDYMRLEEFTGGILAYKYYVTTVDGNKITCNSSATLGSYDVTFELGEGTPVYDVGTQGITCGVPGTVKNDDQVIVIADHDGSVRCVYTLSYTQPGDIYWNVSRKYDSVSRRTTRELDATGCYTYEMLLNGQVVTVRTRDYEIACQMDNYNASCMGLTFNEDGYVMETTHAKNVAGGGIFGSYARVMEIDGNKLYAKKLTGTGIGTEYVGLLSPDCKIINTTAVGTRGEYTQLRYGDQIHALTDNRGKVCYVFVTGRVTADDFNFCWNFDYVSGSKAYRQPDLNGVYHIQLASNGKSFMAWTKDEKLVSTLDGSRFRGVKLGPDNEILSVISANHVYGGSYFCSWYYVEKIDGDQLTVTSGGKSPKVLTGTMSEAVEIYNTSSWVSSHTGEKSTLNVGDRIYAQNDMYGEIRAIYIVNRYVHADVYYNLNRKWSDATNSTTRKPDADGLYSFLIAANGKQVTVKTASLEVANAINSQVAKVVGLTFKDGLVVGAFHAKKTEVCKGGVGVSYEYVKSISGRQITTYKSSTGKTTTFTISRDAKCYNVSSNYDEFRGEATKLRIGDQIHCLKAFNGETNYIYVTKRDHKETTHTCTQGDKKTVWYEWNGTTSIEKSGHYVLTKDAVRISRVTINAGLDVTICLNGHILTCNERVFSVYGKLTLCDHATADGSYKGSVISKYSNTVDAEGNITTKVYGGLAYIYNDKSDAQLNIYSGNYIHQGSATNCGLIFAAVSSSSGYSATVNLYDGKLTGGTVTGLTGQDAPFDVRRWEIDEIDDDPGLVATGATEAQLSTAFFAWRVGYKLTYSDGGIYVTLLPIHGLDKSGSTVAGYESLALALAEASENETYFKLQADLANETVNEDVLIDLNGHKLTDLVIAEGITLTGMDSTTDDYSCTDGYGTLTLAATSKGTVTQLVKTTTENTPAVKRYLAVTEDGVISFHRFYMGITHMNLKPGVTGIGYKALFCGDEKVLGMIDSYGYNLWVGEGNKLAAKKVGAFESGKNVTLRLQNFDVENYGTADVNAEVFLKLTDGTVITSSSYSYTLKGLLEQVAADVRGFTAAQMSALQTMCSQHEEAMQDWAIDSIRNWTAQEAE